MIEKSLKKITLLASDILVNDISLGSTTCSLPCSECKNIYWITGSSPTLTSAHVIQASGTPTVETVFEFIYTAAASLGVGGSLTIFGEGISTSYIGKQLYIISKYNGATWQTIIMPDFGQNNFILENQLYADTSKAGRFLTRATGTGEVESVKNFPSGDVVGTSDAQTLTNKTINSDNNTISNLTTSQFKTTAKSGNDSTFITGTKGTAGNLAQWNSDGDLVDSKTPPSGDIVGTSDTQTLTNKTISASSNTISNIGAGNCNSEFKTEIITVTISLTSSHSVRIKIPYSCNVSTSVNAIQICTTEDVAGGNATLDIQDNSGTSMLLSAVSIPEVDPVGTVYNTTVVANNTVTAGNNILLTVNSTGVTTGLAVVSIPLIKTT